MPRLRTLLGLAAALTVPAGGASAEPGLREQALVRLVRQDCGACHGMQLKGGLGPALTPEALAGKPLQGLAATIFHGRPGTPMPGWRAFMNEGEATWIAEQLLLGFPGEQRAAR